MDSKKLSGSIKNRAIPEVGLNFISEMRQEFGASGGFKPILMNALGIILKNRMEAELIRRAKMENKHTRRIDEEKTTTLYVDGHKYPAQYKFLLPIIKNRKDYPSGALLKVCFNALLLVLEKEELKGELTRRLASSDTEIKRFNREQQREWRGRNYKRSGE